MELPLSLRILFALLIASVILSGCSQVQMFVVGDLANAEAIATMGGDIKGAQCWASLEPAFVASPAPADDGIAVVEERKRLFVGAVSDQCGGVLLPALLKALGKAAGPFGVALPF